MRINSEALDLWAGEAKVQKAMMAFGGQYKRGGDLLDGRAQFPFDDATGLKETFTVIASENISPPDQVDISKIAGGKSFQSVAWMFGYTPDMRHVGFPPSCAAAQRWLLLGSFECLAMELKSLLEYMRKSQPDTDPKLEDVQKFVEDLAAEDLERAIESGVIMCHARVEKKMSIYVPLGWWCMEKAMPENPVIYGAHKSYMTSTPDDAATYNQVTCIFKASGRGASRMEEIHKAMLDKCNG